MYKSTTLYKQYLYMLVRRIYNSIRNLTYQIMTTQKAFKKGMEFPAYTPGTIRLYSMRWCSYAHRARLVLEHKNIRYEIVNIDLDNKPDWFKEKINPLGNVPVLQIDDQIVYESKVVCELLDDLFPINKLTPTDPYQRARDAMFLEKCSKVATAFYTVYCNKDPEEFPKISQSVQTALEVFEKELEVRNTPFLGGESPKMIDFLLWPHIERLNAVDEFIPEFTLTKGRLCRLYEWMRQMLTVRAVQNTALTVDFYKNVCEQMKNGKVDFDTGLEE